MFVNKYRLNFMLVFFASYLFWVVPSNTKANRAKRTLVWNRNNSFIQVIVGFSIPVDPTVEAVTFGSMIEANYLFPTNSSRFFSKTSYEQRKNRFISRWDIYDLLVQLWQIYGFDGKSCLLQTICELSHRPVDIKFGLFEELLHVIFNIFSPKSTKETVRHHADNEYLAARKLGTRSGDACKTKFYDCEINLVDLFTV